MPGLRPSLLLGSLLVGACGLGPDIRGKDRDALLGDARVFVNLARRPADPERAQPIRGIEVDVAGVRGDFTNSQTGRADFDLLLSHVAFRFGARGKHVEFFGLAGVAGAHFDGRTSRGVATDDEHLGVTGGFHFGWRATEWLVPYARVSAAQFVEDAHAVRAEAGVELRPCDALGIHAGYGYWEYEQRNSVWPEPDVDVTTQGLLVGLELRF